MAKPRRTARRTRSGRLSRAGAGPSVDHGTPELQAKRLALVGDADPAFSATMAGVLLARGVLSREQYEAAERFRTLRCALYGPPWPSAIGIYPIGLDDARIAGMKRDFDSMLALLDPHQRLLLQAVCVFDMRPEPQDIAPLCAGLSTIARWTTGRRRA